MPLVTRNSTQGNLFKEATTPNWSNGDLWSDTTLNKVQLNVDGVATDVGTSSFSGAAVVSQSTTIGDYTTPTAATTTSTSSTITVTTSTGIVSNLTANPYFRIANRFESGHAMIDTTFTQIQVDLSRTGSPSGTITISLYNSSGAHIQTLGSISASTISTSKTTYTFDGFSQSVSVNGYVGIAQDSGTRDASNYISVYGLSSGSDANVKAYVYNGTWLDESPTDVYMVFTATSTTGVQLFDNNTATKWTSNTQTNPYAYLDMGSSLNVCAAAFYWNGTDTTETEIKIQTSTDASTWTDKRKITTSNLTNGAWNYYRFNIATARYVRFYGNSGASRVLSLWEVKILTKTDAQIFADLGILEISSSDTSLGPSGT